MSTQVWAYPKAGTVEVDRVDGIAVAVVAAGGWAVLHAVVPVPDVLEPVHLPHSYICSDAPADDKLSPSMLCAWASRLQHVFHPAQCWWGWHMAARRLRGATKQADWNQCTCQAYAVSTWQLV